jgi:hypothetical protein
MGTLRRTAGCLFRVRTLILEQVFNPSSFVVFLHYALATFVIRANQRKKKKMIESDIYLFRPGGEFPAGF